VNEFIQSIIIGLFQGLLEWLPISSEGTMGLVLIKVFRLPVGETLSRAIFLHFGTGLSALIYFRDEIIKIFRADTEEYNDLRLKLFIMTMLTGIVGFPLYMWLDVSVRYGELLLALTGLALIVTGLVQRQAYQQNHSGAELSWPLSIVLGSVQGLAIIPGLSRSGLTTSIMLYKEFTAEEAFKISFLMSIPASFAAVFGMMLVKGFEPDPFSALSAFVAAVIGFITIDTLLKVARRFSFWKICVILGVLAILGWMPILFFP